MRITSLTPAALALLVCAACADQTTMTKPPPGTPEAPKPVPTPLGGYEMNVTGIGTDHMEATIHSVPDADGGPSTALTPVSSGFSFETVSTGSFIEGSRSAGGQRYLTFTFRVRNGTGAPHNNVVMMMVQRPSTISGTALSALRKFDGTNADPSIAPLVVPTGAVTLGGDLVTMQSTYPDVLQVFTEVEAASFVPGGDITGVLPYGYVVRSKNSTADRALPATADPNQWDGLMTVSFRVPLQASSSLDAYALTFQVLAVEDSEVRMTESIEESQDTAAVRRLRDRATSLGATTVTVLNGSLAMDPAVPDYPGQRQICSPRTAGTPGSPTSTINIVGAYSILKLYTPGETVDGCAADFRGGTISRPATNVPFFISVVAMDRYGNIKSAIADTVHLSQVSGPTNSVGPAVALSGGLAPVQVTYTNYGTSLMGAVGRRLMGTRTIPVAGVTRTWTAGASTTDWFTNNNWSPAAVPMSLDSVIIPVAAPLDPVLTGNVQIGGVTVENVATINLMAFDMTASANVTTGTSGGISNTSGRLFLAGIAKTVEGRVPALRVTGTYSLSANLTARAPVQVDAGRLTVSAFRLQADSN